MGGDGWGALHAWLFGQHVFREKLALGEGGEHEVRAPWERKGGTTFHFVNDGLETALRRAREAAGDKDVRISGGGATVLQCLNAGLVDELLLSLAPTFLGGGVRLFEGIDRNAIDVSILQVVSSPAVTHLRYALKKR